MDIATAILLGALGIVISLYTIANSYEFRANEKYKNAELYNRRISNGSEKVSYQMTPTISGPLVPKYSRVEQKLREDLAAAYRLFDQFGWTDLIYNHLTVAVHESEDETERHFLINPFGLLFSEMTASCMVTVDLDGEIIDKGNSSFGINKAGYVIHSAIHRARKDIKCVMHCHSTAGVAVSCLKEGFQYVCQNSAIVGPVSYHDYEGLAVNLEEQERLVEDLGPKNKVMILRNHGLLTCGSSIAEAFFNMYMLNRACEMEVAAMSCGGLDKLIIPDPKLQKFTEHAAASFNSEGIGHKEFAALLRKLDRTDTSYKL